jgi:hypothetical protein
MSNIAKTVSSLFMTIEMSSSALSFAKKDKKNTDELTASKRTGKGALRVHKSLLPPGYDTELKAVNAARAKARKVFDQHTVHVSKTADGTQNEGAKWIRAEAYADGSFLSAWNAAVAEFDAALDKFVDAYPDLLWRLSMAGPDEGLGQCEFDRTEYPDVSEVQAGFALSLKGPFPIADDSIYGSMVLDPKTRDNLEAQYAAEQRRAVAVASQNVAAGLTKYLKTMAEQIGKLGVHYGTPTYERQGKAPAIHDTLAANVAEAVSKARAFAIPDSDQGSKLMAYLDQIEQTLQPDRLDADYIRALPGSYLNNIADTAQGLAEALSGEDWD